MVGSPSMALLTDLGQRSKTVRQLVVWLKKIGNCQALGILEYIGKLTLIIRLVKKTRIINNYWTRFRKYLDLSVASRLVIIIDLRDTGKSRYFAITEFNSCFIIRSSSLCFLRNIFGKRSDLPFLRK